jgi:cation diffusion facilitator family transporter
MNDATRVKIRAAKVAIASNGSLIVLKLAAGVLTGSVGIISDAVHSLMDLVASILSLYSVRKADEPADALHRYGHEKLEDISAGAQAILLLIGAGFVAFEGIHRLIIGGAVASIGIGIAVSAVGAAVNLCASTYLGHKARLTNSAALEATAADLRTDSIVSLGVVVALVAVDITRIHWLDPAAGLLIGVAISSTGVRILNSAGRRLIDETIQPAELEILERVLETFIGGEVVGYHDLRARHVGNTHQVDLHLQFSAGTSLRRAHELSHLVQDAMALALPGTSVLTHLEPQERVRPDRFDTGGHPAADTSPVTDVARAPDH